MSYEMTRSIKFCLSYVPLKWDFIAFKMNIISMRNRIIDLDGVNDVSRIPAKLLLHVWLYDFYDTTLSTEYQQRHMINICNVTTRANRFGTQIEVLTNPIFKNDFQINCRFNRPAHILRFFNSSHDLFYST